MRHVDFGDYQALDPSKNSNQIGFRTKLQIQTLKSAQYVFAVGSTLYSSSRNLNLLGKLSQLTPGVTRSSYSPQPEVLSIATFGRFDQTTEYIKQSLVVCDAFGRLIKTSRTNGWLNGRFVRDARLILVGVETGIAEGIKKRISDLAGFATNVQTLQFIDDPDELLELFRTHGTNVGIVPSLRESFGLVALEFMGHGIPLILSDRTGAFRWLSESYGGEAVGCLTPVQIDGSPDPGRPHPDDVERLFNALNTVGVHIRDKVRDADSLRRRLVVHPWDDTALQFGKTIGLKDGLPSQEIKDQTVAIAMLQARFEAKVTTSIEIARRNEIVSRLDKFVSTGRYHSAQIALNELMRGVKGSVTRDVKLYEIEMETRLGNYLKALRAIDETSRLVGRDDGDGPWDLVDLRMESLRNIALRDLGRYREAEDQSNYLVRWAETWLSKSLDLTEKIDRRAFVASCLRKQARCLAFLGREEDAFNSLERVGGIIAEFPKIEDHGKSNLARGEIYRHNRKFDLSLGEYLITIEMAEKVADLDLYCWGCLCLSDAYFMLDSKDQALDALGLADSAINLFGEEVPVEAAHIRLSRLALGHSPGAESDFAAQVASLVGAYKSRGIDWVEGYFDAMIRTGRPPFPKRF